MRWCPLSNTSTGRSLRTRTVRRIGASQRGTVDGLDHLAPLLQAGIAFSLAALPEKVGQLLCRRLHSPPPPCQHTSRGQFRGDTDGEAVEVKFWRPEMGAGSKRAGMRGKTITNP